MSTMSVLARRSSIKLDGIMGEIDAMALGSLKRLGMGFNVFRLPFAREAA